MTTAPPISPERLNLQARLMTLFTGFQAAFLIASVAELAITDALADGPLTREQLAERTGAHADSVYWALRALATYGIFQELDDGRLALTPMAELLRSDVPGSLRDYARQLSFDWFREAWGEVTHTLRTGETSFDRAHGMRLFEYLPRHPEASDLFSRIMVSRASMEDTVVARSYDFPASWFVIDVGGGHGKTMASILAAFPLLHGVVFDLPSVIAGARDFLQAAGVADRCRAEGGDFFGRVPSGVTPIC
jgi:hypothetical protein